MIKKQRLFRWILWLGLGLWILGIIGSLFLNPSIGGQYHLQWLINSYIRHSGVAIIFIITAVIIPSIEELAFRFWGIGKKYAYAISIGLMAIFVILTFQNFIIATISLAIMLAITFLLKDNIKTIAMIIFSSLVFALCHISGFGNFSLLMLFNLIQISGMALVCCYLTINYGLIFAILIHCINNCFAFVPLFSSHTFEDADYTLVLEEYFGNEYGNTQNGDTLCYTYPLPHIANDIMLEKLFNDSIDPFFYPTMYQTDTNLSPVYRLQIIRKKHQKPFDNIEIIRSMERQNLIKIDTSYESTYYASIENASLLNNRTHPKSYSIGNIIDQMRYEFRVPIKPDNDLNTEYPIFIDMWCVEKYTFDEFSKYLRKNFGIKIWKNESIRTEVVTFNLP